MTVAAPARDAPTWPSGHYELIAIPGTGRHGDVLAVCTAHDPAHVLYVAEDEQWCQSLGQPRYLTRCEAVERNLAEVRSRRDAP